MLRARRSPRYSRERPPRGSSDQKSENEYRTQNRPLDSRRDKARHAHEGAQSHRPHKSGWQRPSRLSAELGRPNANGYHGQEVIESCKWVDQTGGQVGGTVAGVRLSEGSCEQNERQATKGFHGIISEMRAAYIPVKKTLQPRAADRQ